MKKVWELIFVIFALSGGFGVFAILMSLFIPLLGLKGRLGHIIFVCGGVAIFLGIVLLIKRVFIHKNQKDEQKQ